MKKLFLLETILLILFFHDHLSAQEKAIDIRFADKEQGFINFLSQNLKYPSQSIQNKRIGYSITGITITPEGTIKDIKTINSVDEYIDEAVTIALLKSKGKWLKSDITKTDETFFVQVIFQLVKLGSEAITDTKLKDVYNFIEPVFITAMDINPDVPLESNEIIGNKIADCMQSGNLVNGTLFIDELIRRNPFNSALYQLRISLNSKLKKDDLVARDAQKLQNFLPGVSLDQFNITFALKDAKRDSLIKMEEAKRDSLLAELRKNKQNEKVEKMPEFPGGGVAMMKFISRNLRYPVRASENKIQGTVWVQFTVKKDGKIVNPKIVYGPYPELNNEVFRIIDLMPDWKPGIQDGEPVNVNFTFPFKFILPK